MDMPETASDTHPGGRHSGLGKRLLRSIWMPGMNVMAKLRMPGKLAVLVSALAAPLCFFLAKDISNGFENQRHMRLAAESTNITRALIDAHASVCRLRTLSLAHEAGQSAFQAVQAAERKRAAQAVEAVNNAIHNSRSVSGLHLWPGLHSQLQSLVTTGHNRLMSGGSEFETARAGLHEMLHQVAGAGRLSQLAGNPSLRLTTLMVDDLQNLVLVACELTTAGSVALAQADKSGMTERGRLLGVAWTMGRDIDSARISLALLARSGIEAPGSWEQAVELAEHLVGDSKQRFSSSTPGGSAMAFFDTASVVVDQLVSVQHDINNRLVAMIAQRTAEVQREGFILMGLWLAGVLLIGYITTVYLLSTRGALQQLIKAMQATAQGDLSHRVKFRGQDELAELAQSFDQMNERLSDNTSDIRSRAARVDQSGRQVAEGSQQLAMRTDQQAQSVSNAVRAFSEVSAAVSHNAQATRELDELTERLFSQAENGNTAMADTVMAMDELEGASGRVAEMVAVIDDVAFHTGMLALNASVEAARAGDAGKGFAVVAGEVRQLALRCGEAAEEIRRLTSTSAVKVRDSSAKLQHVSVAIDQLVNGVREVSGQLRSIATASTQQTASLSEVEANIESLQTITRDNAALVESSNTASRTLVSQGEALSASVSGMRLRHGSADEARDLVDRALAYAQTHGRDKALHNFNADTQAWIDRDLFVFCLDRSGIILANAMTPARVGLSVDVLDGLRGAHHSERLWDCAREYGSGWVRYQIAHPQTGVMRSKETFVCAIDEATLIGCGCYSKASQGGSAGDTPPSPVAWSRKSESSAHAAA